MPGGGLIDGGTPRSVMRLSGGGLEAVGSVTGEAGRGGEATLTCISIGRL